MCLRNSHTLTIHSYCSNLEHLIAAKLQSSRRCRNQKVKCVPSTIKRLERMKIYWNCFFSLTSSKLRFWLYGLMCSAVTLLELSNSLDSQVLLRETYSMASNWLLVKWAVNCKYQPFMLVLHFDKSWDNTSEIKCFSFCTWAFSVCKSLVLFRSYILLTKVRYLLI